MVNKEEPFLPPRWQVYIGIMTESTRTTNQRWFHIYVPEFLPTTRGDISPEYMEKDITIQNLWPGKPVSRKDFTPNDIIPVTEQTKIKFTKTIYADYFSFDTAADVPMMYRDMQVLVLNYANTDKWYWLPLERDRSLKPFDRIRWSAPDLAKTVKVPGADKDNIAARNAGLTDDNTYYLEIDTRKGYKKIKISTAATDGEKFRYFVEIDPEQGRVEVWDNCVDKSQPNNMILIESKPDDKTKGRITLQNASGNSYVMNGENTIINVPGDLTVHIGGDQIVRREGHYSEITEKSYNRIAGGNESTTVAGKTEHFYKDDYMDHYGTIKTTTVVKAHTESQETRTTLSKTATWTSSDAWTLATSTMDVTAKTLTQTVQMLTMATDSLAMSAKTAVMTFGAFSISVLTSVMMSFPIQMLINVVPYLIIY